ncbi:hypothetical protein GQ457_03G014400 [Hibiscus cannabinus]
MQITSLVVARRQEDRGLIIVQVCFCNYGSMCKQWGGCALFWSMLDSFKLMRSQNSAILVSSIGTLSVVSVPKSNTGIWVSVPAREGIGTPLKCPRYRYLRKGIDTSLVIHQVSVLGEGYRYPSSPLGLEYRYWLLSTDTSCLKTIFGTP